MSLHSDSIPNLIQGVSQQPKSLRSVTQLESQENCYSSPVEGLVRRPPTEHIAIISTVPLDTAFIHTINRSASERYKLVLTNGAVKVFDLDGTPKTITYTDEAVRILANGTSAANGSTYRIAHAPGETQLDVAVSGLLGTGNTVRFQGSTTGIQWTDLASRITDGSNTVTIGANTVFMRANVTGHVNETAIVDVTYKNTRYLNISLELKPLLSHVSANTMGNTITIGATAGERQMRLLGEGWGTATMTFEASPDTITWTSIGAFTSTANTYVDLDDYLYVRARVNNYISGTFSASIFLRTDAVPSRSVMRAMTVADYTFIVNTEKIPAMETTLSSTRPYEGLLFVRQGNYGARYKALIDTTVRAEYQSSNTDPTTIQTANIASQLYDDLVAYGGGYTYANSAGLVYMYRSNTDFTLKAEGNDMDALKGVVPLFSDLPTIAPNNFVIAVDADLTTDQGKYWVKAVSNQVAETFGPVTWQETIEPGIPYRIDATTMPYALVHNPDDTFTFGTIDWGDRVAGSANSAPEPSFIGNPINDVYFHKNRLGFLADENFILSETGEYFNFWRTTLVQIKDTDMIDYRPAHNKVSILKRVVPFNKSLIIFSDLTQFMIPSEVALTPKTVQSPVISEYAASMDAAPINAGKNIYFMFHKGDYEGMSEWGLSEDQTESFEAVDISAHVPAYIPSGASVVSVSTLAGVTAVVTSGGPESIYLFKVETRGNKKLQEAWFRWNYNDYTTLDTVVLDADFIENVMYIIVQRDHEVFLEKQQLVPNRVDPYTDYVTFIDRRIEDLDLLFDPQYNSGNNTTTLDLPYTITSNNMMVVTRAVANNTPNADVGKLLNIVNANIGSSTIHVTGNYASNPLWIGQRFQSEVELSTLYVRKQSTTGGTIIDASSVLQLLRGSVAYSRSGPFTVRVITEGRDDSDYIFTGKLVGDPTSTLGTLSLPSGRFKFGILSNNERTRLQFRANSFLPFHLSSVDWEGTFVRRSKNR